MMSRAGGITTITKRSRSLPRTGSFLLRIEHGFYRRQRGLQIAKKYRHSTNHAQYLSRIARTCSDYADLLEPRRQPLPGVGSARMQPVGAGVSGLEPACRASR